MKRDMDLARSILLKMESEPYEGGWVDVAIEGYSASEVSYHVMLLAKAGLIEADNVSSRDGLAWKPTILTMAGHDFLDASRDQARWEKAKDIVIKKGGALAFEVVKSVLIDLMSKAVAR